MIIAVVTYFQWDMYFTQSLITIFVLIWGIRLSTHIGFRKLREHKEDPRYAKWREEWGSGWYFYVRSFLQIYILQMILMLIISMPIVIINTAWLYDLAGVSPFWFIFSFIGTLVTPFWIIFEVIADIQLTKFIKTKKPWEIFTSWLYRYSRHPNYFGESMFWLWISLISLPFSYYGLISWLVITFLLLFVSGVPLQEVRYAGRPDWEEYKRKTSVFVPWFPKK